MKLNYGCGESKLEGFINIDIEPSTTPDIICDIRKTSLPLEDDSVDEVYCIHTLEHIEYAIWDHLFMEFWRILEPEGSLVIAYPEFEICAKRFLNNYQGQRTFFRAALYGRQRYSGDYHVSPVVTKSLLQLLKNWGFKDAVYAPEFEEDYNTILKCAKGNQTSKDTLFQRNLFKMEV